MIARYTRPEMGRIWSDENKFRQWLAVEIAATETLADAGIVPRSAARAIRRKAGFEVERIHQIEAEVKHDVIAFTTAVAEKVGPESRWLHYGLTSNDVVDTAQALQVRAASQIILADLKRLREVLVDRLEQRRAALTRVRRDLPGLLEEDVEVVPPRFEDDEVRGVAPLGGGLPVDEPDISMTETAEDRAYPLHVLPAGVIIVRP